MAGQPVPPLLRFIRAIGPAASGQDTADGELLARFVRQRDEAAFTALFRRHGPMVWNVCRRVLADPHGAEDAFQATFLVFLRKAGSIGRPELLANYLYGIACRTAAKAKALRARRQFREEQCNVETATADIGDEADCRELRPVLDEELRRLPEKYRAPLVLCYLEGKTYAEAARALG
jgi:RNA polymerase sigma factor (sigma-70 family)